MRAKQLTEKPVPNLGALRKRVDRFLAMPAYYSRQRATDLIARLQETPPVAIFGGLLRDLCFETNRTFYSDVDLVVDSRATTGGKTPGTIFSAVGGIRTSRHGRIRHIRHS